MIPSEEMAIMQVVRVAKRADSRRGDITTLVALLSRRMAPLNAEALCTIARLQPKSLWAQMMQALIPVVSDQLSKPGTRGPQKQRKPKCQHCGGGFSNNPLAAIGRHRVNIDSIPYHNECLESLTNSKE